MTKRQKDAMEQMRVEYKEYRDILKTIATDGEAPCIARVEAIREIFAFDDLHRERVNPFI